MIAKIYLSNIDEECTDDVCTYCVVLDVIFEEVAIKKNQYNNYIKKYICKPLKKKPSKIDKYISFENVIFIREPKVFIR